MPSWNAVEYAARLGYQDRGLAVQLVAWAGATAVGRAMVVFPGHPEAVRAAGFDRVGLGVGLEDGYEAARALYERSGYAFAHGPFVAAARLEDDEGVGFPVASVCVYLVKDLQPS